VVIGLAVGLGLALALSRIFAEVLGGISPHDPVAIAIATTALAISAVVAVAVPARRVIRMEPANLLRQA
jgi:ABC-type antimicrobial peptide transport system permease subunit